jgi:hypothetical protein
VPQERINGRVVPNVVLRHCLPEQAKRDADLQVATPGGLKSPSYSLIHSFRSRARRFRAAPPPRDAFNPRRMARPPAWRKATGPAGGRVHRRWSASTTPAPAPGRHPLPKHPKALAAKAGYGQHASRIPRYGYTLGGGYFIDKRPAWAHCGWAGSRGGTRHNKNRAALSRKLSGHVARVERGGDAKGMASGAGPCG